MRALTIPPAPAGDSQGPARWQVFYADVVGAVYMAGNNGWTGAPTYLRHSAFADDATSRISQTVTVPATAENPTLALAYRMGQDAQQGNSVVVRVTDDISSTIVATLTNTSNGWHLGWADMSMWKGQTVKVTLEWHQRAGNLVDAVLIDDVSLGDWTTPVPQTISPNQIIDAQSTEITVTGLNFTGLSTIFVDGKQLQSVQRVDSTTLKAMLPASLAPGRYDVLVHNADGTESAIAGALTIGRETALPSIMRR